MFKDSPPVLQAMKFCTKSVDLFWLKSAQKTEPASERRESNRLHHTLMPVRGHWSLK